MFAIVGLVLAVAVIGFTLEYKSMTGQYYSSGGGEWYYGELTIQLQPSEACEYAGFEPIYPERVERNEYNTLMSVCKFNGQYVRVPVVQTARVP